MPTEGSYTMLDRDRDRDGKKREVGMAISFDA